MRTSKNLGKKDSLRHILKSLASMYEITSSQFFRNIIGIQLGRDSFRKSRLVMTFLIKVAVAEISCSFRLVLDGKTDKEISR